MNVIQSCGVWLTPTMTWLYQQVRNLPQCINSSVVCDTIRNLEQFDTGRVFALRTRYPIRFSWERALRRTGIHNHLPCKSEIVRELECELLHSHFGDHAWWDMATARATRVRHFATFYGYDVNKLPTGSARWVSRYRELFQSIEKVLCEGPYMASRIRNLGCSGDKVVVHRLGVPVQDIEFQERPWWLRSELRVLLAGSFFVKKGITVALEALGTLKAEIPFLVTVIGDSNGSPSAEAEKARIMEVIRRYDLAGKVGLLGIKTYFELVQTAYSQDVFIAASRTAPDGDTEGGAPVILLDMAASGIPLISTRHCDIPEIVRHGITGTLAEENSSESLAEAIRWFSRNRSEAAQMARAARALVEREFDARIQSCKLARLYLGEVLEKSVEN